MKHYTYRIENKSTGQYYLGVRSCKCEIEDDKYMGSSTIWTSKYIKENKNNLVKTILETFEYREYASKGELKILLAAKNDPLCVKQNFYEWPNNLSRPVSQERRNKASETVKTKYKNGYRQSTSKPVIVEDLLEGTITEYRCNTDFCSVYGFDKQSVGVFIRKGIPYKSNS